MANINEKNRFLRAKDLTPSDILTFANAGQWVQKEFVNPQSGIKEMNDIFEIGVHLNNDEGIKTISLNKSSRESLGNQYGAETEAWIGKQARGIKLPGDKSVIIPK